MNESAGGIGKTGRHIDRHIIDGAQLNGTGVHLGAGGGQFQHFLIADGRQPARFGNGARVGGIDARHIRIDVAAVSPQRRRQRHRSRIGTAAPQGSNVLIRRQPLKTGHNNQPPLRQLPADALRINLADARLAVGAVGANTRLRPAEADGIVPQAPQRHRQQRYGNQLPGGQQQVQLPRIRLPGYGMRQLNQLVRSVPHRGDDGNHPMAGIMHRRQPARHANDFSGISHRTAAIFMDVKTHFNNPPAGIVNLPGFTEYAKPH